jgi:hypothetical protein
MMRYVSLHHHQQLGIETNDADYQRLHKIVRRERGDAREYPCSNVCGRQAEDWSWIHGTDPANLKSYRPLCRYCHREYDRPQWLQQERLRERERIEATNAHKGWTPERREEQRQRMLQKWSQPGSREAQAERAKRDQPWLGRRPQVGGDLR